MGERKFDWKKAGVNEDAFKFKPALSSLNPFDAKENAVVRYRPEIFEVRENGYFISFHKDLGYMVVCPLRWRMLDQWVESVEVARYFADEMDSVEDYRLAHKWTTRKVYGSS